MPWRAPAALSAAACLTGLALCHGASAAEPWFNVAGSPRCSARADELAAAIRSRVAGEPHAALQVEVTLSDAMRARRGAAPIRARIELRLGAESLGVKRLEAATCAEAIEGVVAVVALALSFEAREPHAAAPPASAPPERAAPATGAAALDERRAVPVPRRAVSVPRPAVSVSRRPVSVSRRAVIEATAVDGLRPRQVAAGAESVSLLLTLAADRGTLTEPTLVVGAGAGFRLGSGELRSTLWYALPTESEEVSVGFERLRTDYIAGALGYCRGFDAGEWLSGCTGLELGLVRRSRERQAPDQPRTEQERIAPRLAAALGLTLAYRAAPLAPAFDLCAQFPLLGGLAEARSFGLRAGLSAGMRF
ncbi:MAG: hypothetical protein ABI895_40600 [Deltaproteobacteria bacterium]